MYRVRGFTLLELLTVVAVTAVLAALAAPSFVDQLARRRLEGVAVDLSTDLHFARSQAVSDRNTVQMITEVSGTQYRVANAAGTTLKTVVLPAGIATTDAITVTYDQLRGTSNYMPPMPQMGGMQQFMQPQRRVPYQAMDPALLNAYLDLKQRDLL